MKNLFRMHPVIGYGYSGNDGSLPGIQMVDLRHRDVKSLTQPVFQTFDDMPLFFQRVRMFHTDFER